MLKLNHTRMVLVSLMHQSVASANIPQAALEVFHLLSARVPGFVLYELPGGLGSIVCYHKLQVVS